MLEIQRFENPFTVTSPENMSAENVNTLFVNVFTDFQKVQDPGHMFLHGPRGSGKSMMFRYLLPDSQCLKNNCTMNDLNFFAVHLPIKSTYLRLAEFQRVDGKHASSVLNEHFMVMHFAIMILDFFRLANIPDHGGENTKLLKDLMGEHFFPLLNFCGWREQRPSIDPCSTIQECFKLMHSVCMMIYSELTLYLKQLSFREEILPYDKTLCGYMDFLLPLLREIKKLPFMPNGPIYLLVDDADNLSDTQKTILNTWVSTRTSSEVSLKISTQHQYKNYYTINGAMIETPHDYAEVNISTVYTNSIKGTYMRRVAEIVKKRLEILKINASPEDFFPDNLKQEDAVKEIGQEIKNRWEDEGRGYRPSDDVTRYARSEYMKTLAGQSRSGSTYSYAGFEQLVHISSGIIRFFLNTASQMYNRTRALKPKEPVSFIPPSIQSQVVRDDANSFLFDELEKIVSPSDDHSEPQEKEKIKKLANLIESLGGLFRAILMSERSERRVFSIAFSDEPSSEILAVLSLGIRYGYFHESTIGKKDSLTGGRTRLYILSRRLAPLFNLDPTGFAGYFFMKSSDALLALDNPKKFLANVRKNRIDEDDNIKQLPLFEV